MTFGREFTNAVEQKQIAQQEAGKHNVIVGLRLLMDCVDDNRHLMIHVFAIYNSARARQVHCRES